MLPSRARKAPARGSVGSLRRHARGSSDQLTGLATRDALNAHLRGALAHDAEVSVLYVDLDDFKLVNDTLGHAAGDELLRHVAGAMAAQVGHRDLLARQGGDEFVFVAVGRDALELANDLRSAITVSVELGGVGLRVGVSIGVARSPRDGKDPAALIEAADGAMYLAKRAGRNEIREADPDQWRDRHADRAALELTSTLPEAIARDELTLHWQPLVDVDRLTIIGLEALVRWNHPQRGLLYPGSFVPFAQRTGMITAVDEWVASAVARQRLLWHTQGLDPYVGFNLSPQIARRAGALESLLRRLTDGGLDLDHVTVELTESSALREDRHLSDFVRGLHDAGVTFVLDDFGRAYSSLSRLREVPARWVKLDRGFLERVPQDPAATSVLLAVLDLLRALRFEFIVEGVEREEQLALLRKNGVRLAQGFLLGRPVPADQLYDRLRASPPSQLVRPQLRAA